MKKGETKSYKKEALQAAEDLGYSKETLNDIRKAKDDFEIDRIMRKARSDMAAKEATKRRLFDYYKKGL